MCNAGIHCCKCLNTWEPVKISINFGLPGRVISVPETYLYEGVLHSCNEHSL